MQILTKNWGKVDPLHIESYIGLGGYEAMRKVLRKMTARQVVGEIKSSGLQGRGGAGFSTGEKWEIAAQEKAEEKYFICNLDESETGVYKDRVLAEKNPHQIIEGMMIGSYAIGAHKAYLYINGHYKRQTEILRKALEQAYEKNILGRGSLGSAFDLDIEIFEGAGAYICGEETALINSIEGSRGEPRLRPPYPTVAGLFGMPTVVNNAETLANIPYIITKGAPVFQRIGTGASPGTKLFIVEGPVKSRGIFEAPLGISARELIYNSLYGGGLTNNREFWFAQLGGASGRLIPPGKIDQPLIYGKTEFPLGSGALLVVDKSMDIRELLFSWADFFHRESCGKCVPCREGTFRLWEIAKRIKNSEITEKDKANIDEILWTLSNTAFCPLGNFAATAWKDAMAMFSEEIFNLAGTPRL